MSVEVLVSRLRVEILVSLGLIAPSLVACTDRSVSDSAGTTTDPGGTEDSDGATGEETGDPPTCFVTTLPEGSNLDEYPQCGLPPNGLNGCVNLFYRACVPAEAGTTCSAQCPDGICEPCTTEPTLAGADDSCGAFEFEGQCCSIHAFEDDCSPPPLIDGRPFVVDGITRAAPLAGATDTSAVARHWARTAQGEHASIASFARFTAQLLELGAPPELIRAACVAAHDEVRHAQVALAMASKVHGRRLGFGPLDTVEVRSQAGPTSLAGLVVACVGEGCVGETLAALRVAAAAETCTDPELAATLRTIAADEARHARLAWRTVEWARTREPGLEPTIVAAFEQALAAVAPAPRSTIDDHVRRRLAAHGCLDDARASEVARAGIDQVIRPCLQALLGVRDRPAPSRA